MPRPTAAPALTVVTMGGGQVLGGGVIVVVAVALWLVYLLPSWYSRHQYDAAERNAVRLNQALRVLAETSETPEEVRLELTARTALAQQRLARRAQAEREELAKRSQAELEGIARKAQEQRDAEARRIQEQQEELALRAQRERALAEIERARRELVAARAVPEARRARAHRRARLLATVVALAAVAFIGGGVWLGMATGAWLLLVVGVMTGVLWIALCVRGARVRATDAGHSAAVTSLAAPARTSRAASGMADDREWEPRTLPRPLTASTGSRAAALLDEAREREALRVAALERAMAARVQERTPRPASIDAARAARSTVGATAFRGPADDDAIEAHVRELLLQRRAAG
jgi:hypothetical protein